MKHDAWAPLCAHIPGNNPSKPLGMARCSGSDGNRGILPFIMGLHGTLEPVIGIIGLSGSVQPLCVGKVVKSGGGLWGGCGCTAQKLPPGHPDPRNR